MSAFHRQLLSLLEEGKACATATLMESQGSTPGKQGHRMIVLPDRRLHFTIGGGPLEAMVIEDCLRQMGAGENAVREYRLVPEGPDAVGMVCGGTARVFIEIHQPDPELLVFGAGHVGQEVIRMAAGLGFRRRLADDRADVLAQMSAEVDVEHIHCADAYQGPMPSTRNDAYVVIVTRCHATDREILARFAERPLAYLGMIGSQRKVRVVVQELLERGIPRSALERLHAPVGLPLGGRSPGEIAVSILAQVVAIRRGVSTAESMASAGARLSHSG